MTRRSLRWFLLIGLCALAPLTGRAQGPAQPVFHAIGDLPGGPTLSTVRDATRVGTMIYAVGASAQNIQTLCSVNNVPGCVGAFGQDTAVLWSYDTANNTGSLAALPAIVNNTTAGNSVVANAITPDGAYIASQARIANNNPQSAAVRVTRSLVPFPAANFDLRPAPYNATAPSGAAAISADGSVLWGNNNAGRAMRWDLSNAAGNLTIPLLRPTDNRNSILAHDSSADGRIGAGVSFNSANPALSQAFRFNFNPATNTGSLSGLPFSPNGGTWNRAVDLSANGRFTLLTGDNAIYPLGQVMVHDAATGTLTELGSPASAYRVSGFAGMTDDGAVVAASFFSPNGNAPGLGYVHNAHGWFQVNGMLRRAGIDLRSQGWDVEQSLNITGISGDGTLLFGAMPHNGAFEGFVLEFPAGYLANYDITAQPVTDTSIVGAWTDPNDPNGGAIVFMKDGTYFMISENVPANQTGTNGFERGFYAWDSATGVIQIDTLVDTNGDHGISSDNDRAGIIATVVGDTLSVVVSPNDTPTLVRLPQDLDSFVGTWIMGDPTARDNSRLFIFRADGTYLSAEDGDTGVNGLGGHDGMESGTYQFDAAGYIAAIPVIDTNGDWGLSDPIGQSRGLLDFDGLTALGGDDSGMGPLARVIDPNAVRPVITSATPVDGIVGQPLAYQVTGTFKPWMFGAAGLPAGLGIDGGTGAIAGTPAAPGTFDVTVTAANTLASGSGVIQFVIHPITCTAGSYRAADTDVACTPAPAGFYVPVDGATAALACPVGTYQPNTGSTVCFVAPAGTYVDVEGAVAPITCPTGLSSDAGATACDDRTAPAIDAHANISVTSGSASGTTVTYTAPATHDTHDGDGVAMCAPASGSTFATGTTTVTCTATDAAGNTATSSFTVTVTYVPAHVITRSGFFAPVKAGVNVVKGGSTVPLKFTVAVDGVAKTTTDGLALSATPVSCATGAATGAATALASTGGTSLRYSDGQFIMNWTVPSTASACYVVRMTTTADGGSIAATFQVK